MSMERVIRSETSTAERTVVVLATGLDAEARAVLQIGAEWAGARILFWESAAAPWPMRAGVRPALLVSVLNTGERRVPADIIRVATSMQPDIPILLICKEPLVERTYSLRGGKLNLIGLPLKAESISQQIAYSLPGTDTGTRLLIPRSRTGRGCAFREYNGSGWWATLVWRRGAAEDPGEHTPAPILCRRSEEGFVACLRSDSDELGTARDIQQLEATLASDKAPFQRVAVNRLTATSVALAFSARKKQWLFHGGGETYAMWLGGPLRIPKIWNVAHELARTKSHGRQLRAGPCDAALMAVGVGTGTDFSKTLLHATQRWRGTHVRDHLEHVLDSDSTLSAILMVETD